MRNTLKAGLAVGATLALVALGAPLSAFADDAAPSPSPITTEVSPSPDTSTPVLTTTPTAQAPSAPSTTAITPITPTTDTTAIPVTATHVAPVLPIAPKTSYVIALWSYDSEGVKFPQTLVTSETTKSTDVHALDASATTCGTTYQSDLYANDKITRALIDSGHLTGSGESWPGGSYQGKYSNTFTTPACPVVVPPADANPHANVIASCGVATAWVSNDLDGAAERLTASFVVYIDGTFNEALSAAGGEVVSGTPIAFAEDTGTYIVTVRTGPAFGDVLLSTATVESDCLPPVVVIPPQPADIVTATSTDAKDCDATTIVTTIVTTTTGTAYDAASNSWLPTEPVSVTTTSTRPATADECPAIVTPPTVTPPTVTPTPPATHVTPVTPVSDAKRLAYTGTDSAVLAGMLGSGLAALILGIGGIVFTKLRSRPRYRRTPTE